MELRKFEDVRVDAHKMLKSATDRLKDSRKRAAKPETINSLELQIKEIEFSKNHDLDDAKYAMGELKKMLTAEQEGLRKELKALQKKQTGKPVPPKPL